MKQDSVSFVERKIVLNDINILDEDILKTIFKLKKAMGSDKLHLIIYQTY